MIWLVVLTGVVSAGDPGTLTGSHSYDEGCAPVRDSVRQSLWQRTREDAAAEAQAPAEQLKNLEGLAGLGGSPFAQRSAAAARGEFFPPPTKPSSKMPPATQPSDQPPLPPAQPPAESRNLEESEEKCLVAKLKSLRQQRDDAQAAEKAAQNNAEQLEREAAKAAEAAAREEGERRRTESEKAKEFAKRAEEQQKRREAAENAEKDARAQQEQQQVAAAKAAEHAAEAEEKRQKLGHE